MSDIYEQTQEYGKIDLTHVLKPMLAFLEQPDNMQKFIMVRDHHLLIEIIITY